MLRCKLYPNYTNYYYYTIGSKVIKLERKIASETIYKRYIEFDTIEQAKEYFETECGA